MHERVQFAALFDLDNTLHNTYVLIIMAIEYAFKELGYPPISRDKINTALGFPLKECYRKLNPNGNIEGLCIAHRDFQSKHLELVVPFPNSVSTLRTLQEKGIKTAVVTSRSRNMSLENLERTGVGEVVDFVVTRDDVINIKPDSEPVQKALTHLGVSAKNAWMTGDAPEDILAGRAAGTKTIAIRGKTTTKELAESCPDYIISDIAEVVPIILTYIKAVTSIS